jgi:hypothetical protein
MVLLSGRSAVVAQESGSIQSAGPTEREGADGVERPHRRGRLLDQEMRGFLEYCRRCRFRAFFPSSTASSGATSFADSGPERGKFTPSDPANNPFPSLDKPLEGDEGRGRMISA